MAAASAVRCRFESYQCTLIANARSTDRFSLDTIGILCFNPGMDPQPAKPFGSLAPRSNGIVVPGFTDKILPLLPKPYDLLAEWSRYCPLHYILNENSLFFVLLESIDNDDGTTTLFWSKRQCVGEDVTIPTSLLYRSKAYFDTISKQFVRLRGHSEINTTIFEDADGPISPEAFAEAVMDCAAQLL